MTGLFSFLENIGYHGMRFVRTENSFHQLHIAHHFIMANQLFGFAAAHLNKVAVKITHIGFHPRQRILLDSFFRAGRHGLG